MSVPREPIVRISPAIQPVESSYPGLVIHQQIARGPRMLPAPDHAVYPITAHRQTVRAQAVNRRYSGRVEWEKAPRARVATRKEEDHFARWLNHSQTPTS